MPAADMGRVIMSILMVEDYLQTQGLRLSAEAVQVARLTAQMVMDMGKASIEREVLWYAADGVVLSEHLSPNEEREALLKQIFMALDSVFSRHPAQSAVVYALMPEPEPYLVRLAQQGERLEQHLPVSEESAWHYLPSRSAQTGWLNIGNDVPHWLALEELKGGHHVRSGSQMSLPVCTEQGAVLGVVYVEQPHKHAFDDEAQTEWVALALALARPLQALLKAGEDVGDECE